MKVCWINEIMFVNIFYLWLRKSKSGERLNKLPANTFVL